MECQKNKGTTDVAVILGTEKLKKLKVKKINRKWGNGKI